GRECPSYGPLVGQGGQPVRFGRRFRAAAEQYERRGQLLGQRDRHLGRDAPRPSRDDHHVARRDRGGPGGLGAGGFPQADGTLAAYRDADLLRPLTKHFFDDSQDGLISVGEGGGDVHGFAMDFGPLLGRRFRQPRQAAG